MPITLITDTGEFQAREANGLLLTESARKAGLKLNTRCGEAGICGGCAATLERGEFVVAGQHVTVQPGGHRTALACLTRLASEEAVVSFPSTSVLEREAKIDEDFVMDAFERGAQTLKLCVDVPPPTLTDPAPDWDRLERELLARAGPRQLAIPLGLLQRLPAVLEEGRGRVTVTLGRTDHRGSVIDVEPGDTTSTHLGLAVDIGTTTVVAMLVDLNLGKVLAKASMYNQQIAKADDVASRISYCSSADAVGELQRLVVDDTVNQLVRRLCQETGASGHQIGRLAVSGNTVMIHLFLGLSPESIGRIPFQPVANVHGEYVAEDLGLAIAPHGVVDVVPSVAGYVGGDVTSDMYVANLRMRSQPTLLVDIGTNGEIVFSEEGRMVACATAAGPAFEGYGLSHGCRASTGAIEHIRFDGSLEFELEVIGGTKPIGLCGSAIVDFVACGLHCGLLNRMGRFDVEMLKAGGRYLDDEQLCGTSKACLIADSAASGTGRPLFVSEQDLAEVMKAKAAVYAGMKTLLATQDRAFGDIERFCLAGGFARHLDLRNAISMGLLPELSLDRFDVIGNGSLAGAFLALVEFEAMAAYEALVRLPEVIELNLEATFESNFIDALALPNLNGEDFPETLARLSG